MKYLLASDLHLTDSPLEEYRWKVFSQLAELAIKHRVSEIVLLGDVWDRKDRHSSQLVNRSIEELVQLRDTTASRITILMGNHDEPLNGPSFFSFINNLQDIRYVTKPYNRILTDVWWLPFAAKPVEAWKDLPLHQARCIFIHQTVTGALTETDHVLEGGTQLPILPRSVAIYSGDVHRPQQVGAVTYIGTPYPTRFGENWGGRALLIDSSDFKKYTELPLECIQRKIIDMKSTDERIGGGYFWKLKPADQIRIRYHLGVESIDNWPIIEREIRDWAKALDVVLLSVEAVIEQVMERAGDTAVAQTNSVEQLPSDEILKLFAEEEKLSEPTIAIGLEILAVALG